jgi:hypothetical protein
MLSKPPLPGGRSPVRQRSHPYAHPVELPGEDWLELEQERFEPAPDPSDRP